MAENLHHIPPHGVIKVKMPGQYHPGWKANAPQIKLNMRYYPSGEYVVPGLPLEMYDVINARRSQRSKELGRSVPKIVPHRSLERWKRPELKPRSLGAASAVAFPKCDQWGATEENETEITWINSNWFQHKKPPKKQRPLLPSGNPDLFS
jgi:hypothetical protein